MTALSAPDVATDRIDGVLQVFQTAVHPLTLKQVQKLYSGPKLARNELPRIVEESLISSGRLFKCSASGKQARYWVFDEEKKVREILEALLAREPMPENKLTTAVNKALSKVSSPPAIRAVIERMRLDRQLHEVPGKGTPKALSLKPLDPVAFFRKGTLKDLAEALAKAATFGVNLDQFLEQLREHLRSVHVPAETAPVSSEGRVMETKSEAPAPSPSVEVPAPSPSVAVPARSPSVEAPAPSPSMELEELILKGMRDLDSTVQSGSTVLLRDLRRHMPAEYRRHDTFDAAVVRLAEQGRVVLHRHDQPSFLTAEERDELVRDATGNCYTTIALRANENSGQAADRVPSNAEGMLSFGE